MPDYKEYKNPSNVSGKSIKDILSITPQELNKMDISDLRRTVGRLVSAGNKRVRRFTNKGESSPAVEKLMRSGGLLSTAGKNINQLRMEFARARNFLTSDVSTRRGWERVKKETVNALQKHGVNVGKKDFEIFWKAYENVKEKNPEIANKALKYAAMKEVAEIVNEKKYTDAENVAEIIKSRLESSYESMMENDESATGISDFLEF